MFCNKYAIISLITPQTQTHRYAIRNSSSLVSFCTCYETKKREKVLLDDKPTP